MLMLYFNVVFVKYCLCVVFFLIMLLMIDFNMCVMNVRSCDSLYLFIIFA